MNTLNGLIGNGMGSIFTVLMLSACLYFILTYFEHLKQDNKSKVKQSKLFAVITLFLALGVPAIYQLYIYYLMMQWLTFLRIQIHTIKRSQTQVWTRTEPPQTLLHQRLRGVACNIIYTRFYARSSKVRFSKGFNGFRGSICHRCCWIKSCIF